MNLSFYHGRETLATCLPLNINIFVLYKSNWKKLTIFRERDLLCCVDLRHISGTIGHNFRKTNSPNLADVVKSLVISDYIVLLFALADPPLGNHLAGCGRVRAHRRALRLRLWLHL